MRIAFDVASNWDPRGGVWRYGLGLARALVAMLPRGSVRIPCFDRLPTHCLDELRATGATVRYNPLHSRLDPLESMSHRNGRLVPWNKLLPVVYRPWVRRSLVTSGLAGCDVYHALFTCRLRPPGQAVVGTIHDMIPYLFPELSSLSESAHRRILEYHRRWADQIIVPSEATRHDLLRMADFPPEIVKVVHHGIDQQTFRTTATIPEALLARHRLRPGKFFLYVGAVEARKNIDRMVRAYREAVPMTADIPLVIVGKRIERIEAIDGEEADPRIREIGYVAEADLPGLYASARGLIHVAFVEGFGFTPLEALACGTPVIVSRDGASGEVAGRGGLMVDPHDTANISRAIRELASNDPLRARLSREGQDHVRSFTWETAAEKTLAVYHEALAISRQRRPELSLSH